MPIIQENFLGGERAGGKEKEIHEGERKRGELRELREREKGLGDGKEGDEFRAEDRDAGEREEDDRRVENG